MRRRLQPPAPPPINLRAQLAWSIGLDARQDVAAALTLIAQDGPMLLVGPRGCDQAALARAIHADSSRNRRAFVALEEPPRDTPGALWPARGGTAYVDLDVVSEVGPRFARVLFGWDRALDVRPIIAAPDQRALRRLVGILADGPVVHLRPLQERGADVPRLLDALLVQAGVGHRVAELGNARVEGLTRARWAHNLDSLRAAVPKLAAYLSTGCALRETARILGVTHQTVSEALRGYFGEGRRSIA